MQRRQHRRGAAGDDDDDGERSARQALGVFKPYVAYYRDAGTRDPDGVRASRRFRATMRLYPQIDARIDWCRVDAPDDGAGSDANAESRALKARRRARLPAAVPTLIDELGVAWEGEARVDEWLRAAVAAAAGGRRRLMYTGYDDVVDASSGASASSPLFSAAARSSFRGVVPADARPLDDIVAQLFEERRRRPYQP